jgi:hypothetical protein
MASVIKRGTRDRPKWYCKLKIDGVWRMMPTHQPTKTEARKWAEEKEGRLARGLPLEEPEPDAEKTFGEALTYWLENAQQGRARLAPRQRATRQGPARGIRGPADLQGGGGPDRRFPSDEARREGEGRQGRGVAGAIGGDR